MYITNKLKEKHGKSVKLSNYLEYTKYVQKIRDYTKNEINRILNKIIKVHNPGTIILENLDFRGSNIGRKNNRLLHRFGMGIIKKKMEDLKDKGYQVSCPCPAYSSQTCHKCEYVDKKNRIDQATFVCKCCGQKSNADYNGAETLDIFSKRFGEEVFASRTDRDRKRTLLVKRFMNSEAVKADDKRIIRVDALARVEGEGGLSIKIRGGEVEEAQFRIFEPPRFFEAFLRGRHFLEAPDITARICGICPIAYMMSASQAMESGLGVEIPKSLEALRRLIYCGEWIESHALHVYLLHAPDFLGYEDAIRMAKDHPGEVKRGLKLKRIGNDLVSRIGGREVHPVNLKVGGFYRAPDKEDLLSLKDPLLWARDAAYATVRWVSSFPFPDHEEDYEFVCLQHPEEYAILRGMLVSNKGLTIPVSRFETHFKEEQVPHSTALHAAILGFAHPITHGPLRFETSPPEDMTALQARLETL